MIMGKRIFSMKKHRMPGQQSRPQAVAAMVAITSPELLSGTIESGSEGVKTKIPTETPTRISKPTRLLLKSPEGIGISIFYFFVMTLFRNGELFYLKPEPPPPE